MKQQYRPQLISVSGETLYSNSLSNSHNRNDVTKINRSNPGDTSLGLKMGVFNHSLAAQYKLRLVKSCTLLATDTSCDSPRKSSANLDLHLSLADELRKRSLRFSENVATYAPGQRPSGSFLIWGLSLEAAKVLGAKYEQSEMVWCGHDAVPRLLAL